MPDLSGLLEVFCGLIIAGAVLVLAAFLSRRSHGEPRAAAEAAAPRPRAIADEGTVATLIAVQPRTEITGPYGYDNGLVVAREES